MYLEWVWRLSYPTFGQVLIAGKFDKLANKLLLLALDTAGAIHYISALFSAR